MIDLHVYDTFWRAEVKRLSSLAAVSDPDSVEGWVARAFHLAAQVNVARVDEWDKAASWAPWAFYDQRARSIEVSFVA